MEEDISDSLCESCETSGGAVEKSQKTEDVTSKRSFIILRRQELEVISRFLNVAQKSINNIKTVISECQTDD